MNGKNMKEVQSFKHLGVTITKDLNWDEHIENLTVKANQCLDVLNALKYKLDRNTLEKLYFAFIWSKVEYANIVWDNCSIQSRDMIESVQYRAAKIVSGAIHRTSHNIVYNELGWERLEDRRRKQRLRVFYKTIHEETPVYLQNIVTDRNIQNQYQLRNVMNYPIPRTRTSSFQRSFLPQTISDWNDLDPDVRLCNSLESFTNELDKHRSPPPTWYSMGDRCLNIFHSRLRMLCSPLNDHLYSLIHVVDQPNCPCGHIRENNKHFLLDCPLYNNEHIQMIADLNLLGFEPLLNNLLYGNATYSEKTNQNAFLVIQQFIQATKRFS